MIRGTPKYIFWEQYLSPRFRVKTLRSHNWSSCGSATLALVTGIAPGIIQKAAPGRKGHWSTRAVKNFLRTHGYTVFDVTKSSVTNCDWPYNPLQSGHLLLINSEVDSREASWFLTHNGELWHNDYRDYDFTPLFFLNKPTQDVLLVHSPKWSDISQRTRIR